MRPVSVITGVSTDLPPSHPVSSSLIVSPPPAFFVASHLSFPLLVFCTWIISLSPLRLSSSPSSSFTPWSYLCSWPSRSYFCPVNGADLNHCHLTGWSDHGVSAGARHLRGILMMWREHVALWDVTVCARVCIPFCLCLHLSPRLGTHASQVCASLAEDTGKCHWSIRNRNEMDDKGSFPAIAEWCRCSLLRQTDPPWDITDKPHWRQFVVCVENQRGCQSVRQSSLQYNSTGRIPQMILAVWCCDCLVFFFFFFSISILIQWLVLVSVLNLSRLQTVFMRACTSVCACVCVHFESEGLPEWQSLVVDAQPLWCCCISSVHHFGAVSVYALLAIFAKHLWGGNHFPTGRTGDVPWVVSRNVFLKCL